MQADSLIDARRKMDGTTPQQFIDRDITPFVTPQDQAEWQSDNAWSMPEPQNIAMRQQMVADARQQAPLEQISDKDEAYAELQRKMGGGENPWPPQVTQGAMALQGAQSRAISNDVRGRYEKYAPYISPGGALERLVNYLRGI